MGNFLKKINIFRYLEFEKEAVVLFANLKRNNKAYEHLDKYARTVGFISYVLGMIVVAVILTILKWI